MADRVFGFLYSERRFMHVQSMNFKLLETFEYFVRPIWHGGVTFE
jgi:hypothetical protein